MANTVQQISLKCFKWVVKASSASGKPVSDAFSYQDVQCNLEFSLGSYNVRTGSSDTSRLYFKSCRALQSPVTVHVKRNSEILPSQTTSITSENQAIWNYSSGCLVGYDLKVEIIIHNDSSKRDILVQTPLFIDAKFQLEGISKNLSSLFEEGSNHDVEFTCGDQTVKAHRNVLSCRSGVLATMLQTDMIEGNTGQVKIQDMEGSVFKKFLRCLYTGMLHELSTDTAVQIYEASDKYAVDTIKQQCSNYLVENLTPENVCDILIVADRHDDSDFKSDVMEYMMREKIPLMGEKWIDFCKENKTLSIEVLNLFCHHLSGKLS